MERVCLGFPKRGGIQLRVKKNVVRIYSNDELRVNQQFIISKRKESILREKLVVKSLTSVLNCIFIQEQNIPLPSKPFRYCGKFLNGLPNTWFLKTIVGERSNLIFLRDVMRKGNNKNIEDKLRLGIVFYFLFFLRSKFL